MHFFYSRLFLILSRCFVRSLLSFFLSLSSFFCFVQSSCTVARSVPFSFFSSFPLVPIVGLIPLFLFLLYSTSLQSLKPSGMIRLNSVENSHWVSQSDLLLRHSLLRSPIVSINRYRRDFISCFIPINCLLSLVLSCLLHCTIGTKLQLNCNWIELTWEIEA